MVFNQYFNIFVVLGYFLLNALKVSKFSCTCLLWQIDAPFTKQIFLEIIFYYPTFELDIWSDDLVMTEV